MIKNIFLVLVILISSNSLKSQELMNVSGESVSLEEFESTLMKNNNDKEINKEYLDNYVDLFVNYKLKVLQAKELGLDKEEAFISELEVYRKQLAKPYLQAKEFKEGLILEAYNRMKFDVNASHILFRLDEKSNSSDTLNKYNLALKAKTEIEAGSITFENAVTKYSEENYNNGNLGWFTAFAMVYNFETAAFTTEVGSLSNIVRTKYGYHLVKVNNKRLSVGEVKISHIMFKFSKGITDEEKTKIKLKADEVYNKLQSGENFADLADRFSEDRSTAVKGGALPWFGLNKMAKEFEIASFSIEKIGDFTAPFITEYGWHIVILNDRKVVGTLIEETEQIKTRIDKGARNLLTELALLKKLKIDYSFTENKYISSRKNLVKKSINLEKLIKGSLTKEDLLTVSVDSRELFTIDGISYSQADFKEFILEYQDVDLDFNRMYSRFVDFSCLIYKESKLEEEEPEYKRLLSEFRDGILLFDLTSEMVWTKSMEDTVGLKNYFENNSDNYLWEQRVEANIYTCANQKIALKLKRQLWKKSKGFITVEEIMEDINKNSPLNLQHTASKYGNGDNKFVDQVEWKKGNYELSTESELVIVVEILSVLDKQAKELKDTRGKVISDYQNYLEENWLTELRLKYPVTIDTKVLYSIIK